MGFKLFMLKSGWFDALMLFYGEPVSYITKDLSVETALPTAQFPRELIAQR